MELFIIMEINKNKIKAELQEVRNLIMELDPNSAKKSFNLSGLPIGKVIELIFRDLKLVIKKTGDNIYEIIENGDSLKLKEGDLIRFKNNDINNIKTSESLEFEIFRKALDYRSDPLEDVN